jgi:hypothetical protein
MQEPTIDDIETALDVLEYYEHKANNKDERMLAALMSDSQSHITSYAPIVLEDRQKYQTVMDLS